jgi:hypothetical protein
MHIFFTIPHLLSTACKLQFLFLTFWLLGILCKNNWCIDIFEIPVAMNVSKYIGHFCVKFYNISI